MPPKVIVLGAGIGQLRVIELCKEAGCKVIVVSREKEQYAVKFADQFYLQDIREKEAILEIARNENIDGILTDQVDAGVLTAAYVAEKLNLPGIGFDIAKKFTNKLVMRQQAQALGINVPAFSGVKNIEEALESAQIIGYPLIIKPSDNSASIGVYLINNENQLREHFAESLSYSPGEVVMVEQYIIGEEYCVLSFCRDYHNTNLVIARRDMWNIPGKFIPRATVYCDVTSAVSNVEQRILEMQTKLVNGFGLKFGIVQGEYYYNMNSNKIYLGEIAARGGAVFTSSDLIPLASGVDASQLFVKLCLGIDFDNEINIRKGAAGYFCFLLPSGKIIDIRNTENISNIPGVHMAFLQNVSIGMEITPARDKTSRKGPVLVYGKNKEECYEVMERVKQVLQIDVETATGEIKGIQW